MSSIAYNTIYRATHREEIRRKGKEARRNYKRLILNHYGNSCAKCGFSDIRALQLDHINNNGSEERKLLGGSQKFSGWQFYKWVVENDYPEGYQTLCANCNMIKQLGEDF